MIQKVFGKAPAGDRLKKMQQSPHYTKGAFQNIHFTPVMAPDTSIWKTFKSYLNKPRDARPPGPLPFEKTDLRFLENDVPVVVWFGHSSYLIRINGLNILVDPVFSNHASPFSFMIKAYPGADAFSAADMPPIDLLVQTHDHYDHLDYESVSALQTKVKKVITTLGTGSHFEYWGYDPAIITELPWWDTTSVATGIQLTATPARHFSGRGIARGKTQWGGFVLKTAEYAIYIGGDSGYDTHFKEIGNKFGPFDLAILECGQYNAHWPYIHMMPEQTAQAAVDLQAKRLLPVHWAKFTLALHAWNDPIKRVVKKAAELQLPITTPKIGEPVLLGKFYPEAQWWNF